MLKTLKFSSGRFSHTLFTQQYKSYLLLNFYNRRVLSTTQKLNYKVCVVGGAGGIGQPLSLLLKLNPLVSQMTLYDVAKVTPGVAVDLSHIDTNGRVHGGFVGPENLGEALKCSNVVVIPAGVPRKPGMERADLFKTNASVVYATAKCIADYCPEAFVAIITNPVNSTVPVAAQVLEKAKVFNPKKLFGVTTLDVVRARTFIGDILHINPLKVEVHVLCGHSGNTIVPILSKSTPALKLDQKGIEKLTKRIQNCGTEVVEAKAGGGSATLSMAHAAARFVDSLLRALDGVSGIVECAYVKSDISDTEYFSSPLQLGKGGVHKFLKLPELNKYEEELLKRGLEELKSDIETGNKYAAEQKD